MHSLVLLCINQHTIFEVPSFTDSKNWGLEFILKTGHVSLTTPISGYFVVRRLTRNIFYQHTKSGDFSFSHAGV